LAEAAVGDIAPKASKYLGVETKKAAEEKALKDIVASLGQEGQTYLSLWSELSQGRSVESKVVRVSDKLEMIIQAYEYERAGFRNLDDFWENPDQISGWDVDGIVDQLIGHLKEMRKEVASLGARNPPRRKRP
jgi:putative hydrolase of HD superfamily